MKYIGGLPLLLILLSLSLKAQPGDDFRIKRLGTEDGLSHRWALSVHQDVKGFIWVGTYDGLNRYDGHDFTVYRPSASGKYPVKADVINAITETPDGNLFLSTFDGIIKFNPENATFESVLTKVDSSNSILLLGGNKLNFLSNYFFYEGNPASLKVYDRDPSGEISLLSTSEGFPFTHRPLCPVQCNKARVWFWDFEGSYYSYDLRSKKWKQLPVAGSMLCPVDDQNTLWVPVDDQLKAFPLPSEMRGRAWGAFTFEPGQAVWLYSADPLKKSSLYKFDLLTKKLLLKFPSFNESEYSGHRFTAPNAPFHYVDREGTLWFAGFLGLYHIRQRDQLFQQYLSAQKQTQNENPDVRSIRYLAEDNAGSIYCLMNGDMYKIDTAHGNFIKISFSDMIVKVLSKSGVVLEKGQQAEIFSILRDDEDHLYLGTAVGIIQFNPWDQSSHLFEIPGGAHFLLNDFGDRIFYSNEKENYFFQKSTGTSEKFPGSPFTQYQLPFYDRAENTLLGYNDTAIIKINMQNLDIEMHKVYHEPREQRCLVVHHGSIWVGTSRGLEKIDPKTFTHINYDRSDGLPGNFIYSLVAEGDYLYLGTSDGLCRFNINTGEVKNYYVEDGLSHNEFNTNSTLKSTNGRIYMGGLNGINAFYPLDLERKKTASTSVLLSRYSLYDSKKDSLIFHNDLEPVQSIILSPSISSVNFYLALSSYIDPDHNQYAWRMEGLDEDWFHADNQHVATYRHIPPGHYTFKARASDPFGHWSEKELSIPIIVLAPWYARWWAWLIYIVVLAAGILAIYRNQLRKRIEHAENLRLQELDTFKNRFFTNITHEFRTPLTVILGLTEKLQEEKNESRPQHQGHVFTLVRRNAESLLRLINQILDLAKLESHSLKMNYVQGDVLPYLKYITESLQSFANAQNLLLRVESNKAQIMMDFDPERLQQIIHNLISNAIKFTPGGGRVTLSVKLIQHPEEKHQQQLKLGVSDTGAGIPSEDIPKIFDRFYQANNLEKSNAGGTGIGLSLTKELVKAMKGEITVESTVGKGTIFTVTLPVTKTSTVAHHDIWTANENAEGESLPLIQQRFLTENKPDSLPQLLLIEDNPDVVEYLITCLDSAYRLEYAYNGRAGIEKAFELSPDLIISDVMMPEKTGFEVTDELKNDQRTSHIPIVLLTAKADIESRIAGLRRGADAYLAKPFHQEELLATLTNLLENRRKLQSRYLDTTVNTSLLSVKENDKSTEIKSLTTAHEDAFLTRLKTIIEEHLNDAELDVEMICKKIGMGRTNLHNKMTALTGLSTISFVRRLRLQKAKELLATTEMNISEIAYEVGFNDPRYFSRVFSEEFGLPPTEFKMRSSV
ncbi:MAG TPA: ATP-binding protein [Saprospiraceae bacterium]|nr:ATP-binding protein [Saprospiraceae bacterium]